MPPENLLDLLVTFLISLSPLGEARVGIPYGVLQGLPVWLAWVTGTAANLLIYPLFVIVMKRFNIRLWRYRPYRKQSIRLARKAHSGVGRQIQRYGFWGLMIFVMIPLPVTGAYMGSIAAQVFRIKKRKALAAISVGVIISCGLMTLGSFLGHSGISRL